MSPPSLAFNREGKPKAFLRRARCLVHVTNRLNFSPAEFGNEYDVTSEQRTQKLHCIHGVTSAVVSRRYRSISASE
jgi:hypothetical protein